MTGVVNVVNIHCNQATGQSAHTQASRQEKQGNIGNADTDDY